MIFIEEHKSNKIPGGTSLFISFNYDSKIVEIIKQCSVANYDKKSHIWEVPCVDLSFLCNALSVIDDITIKLLNVESTEEINSVVLNDFKTTPFDYQKDGIEYGLNHDKFLLLDAPGLGKTLQLIYIAE
jgi:hypothetical protein